MNGGALGGNGIVAGAVTIGNGILAGATLAPGVNGIGLLTIQSGLTFKANSRYAWNLELSTVRADEAIAQSVMIEPGASILMTGRRHAVLPVGTIFTVISNTAATPISGTFANLADGATITIGGNNFQVSYSGGDGNDLTLTVAPSTNR